MFFDRTESGATNRRALLGFVLTALLVGMGGTIFTEPSIPTWYADLKKPDFNPPNWIFAPVWTTLYVLMGVAAWRVWRKTGLWSRPIALYAIQLALNLGWTAIFFGMHAIGLALFEILALLLLIVLTAGTFWRHDRIAGLLFVPYIVWVGFATALTHALWVLNP